MDAQSALENVSLQDVALTIGSPPFIFCLGISILVLFYLHRNPSIISDSREFLASTHWRLEHAIALAMLLMFLLFLARAVVSTLVLKGFLDKDHIASLSIVLQTLLFHLPIILIILWQTFRMKGLRHTSPSVNPSSLLENIGKGVIAYLAAIPAILAANLLSWVLLQRLSIPPEPQFAVQILIGNNPAWLKIYLIIMAVASAPLAEELLFRSVCFPALAKQTAPFRAALLISLLFAAIHLNAYAFMPLFVMALALSAAYAWTKSIVVPITMHALFNAVNLSLYFLYEVLQQQT